MPAVEIPDDLYKRLEQHARGFDTPVAVISRAVDALEDVEQETPVVDMTGKDLPEFEALSPPDLTHTKVVVASFNGKAINRPNWKQLVETAIIYGLKTIGDFSKLQRIAAANMVQGRKTNEGYHYLSEIDISVQGQDANNAWRSVSFIAQNLKVAAEVSFIWRNTDGAEQPGKPGTMRIHRTQTSVPPPGLGT